MKHEPNCPAYFWNFRLGASCTCAPKPEPAPPPSKEEKSTMMKVIEARTAPPEAQLTEAERFWITIYALTNGMKIENRPQLRRTILEALKKKEEEGFERGAHYAYDTETQIHQAHNEAEQRTARECVEIAEEIQKLADNRPEMLEMKGEKYAEGYEVARLAITNAIKRKISQRFKLK